MRDLLKEMLSELNTDNAVEQIKWLTDKTPDRISGGGQDRKAAEHIVMKMSEYGLDSEMLEFEAYNSHPGTSEVRLSAPHAREIKSLPCGHIKSTPDEGVTLELVYMGAGGEDEYIGKDVRGKALLVEVSYSPATPEKAMLASEHGAAALVCMNWGKPEKELICNRALKAVWGNPTPESFEKIPQIYGVNITRKDGEYLRDLCLTGEKVELFMNVKSSREWMTLPMPFGVIKGSEEPEKFLLVSGHLDAWAPGVTCNATGNGTMLELARVFGKFKDKIRRSIYFVYWNGHEIAEAAGSTWFLDYFFQDVNRNCIGYINVDSTGMKGAKYFGCDASRELTDFAHAIIKDTIGEDCDVQYLNKTGDQSFFGVGVPAIAGRISYTPETVAEENGATLGYWNHTVEDSIDKMDVDNLDKDNKVHIGMLLNLANSRVLPYDFTKTCLDLKTKVEMLKKESGNVVDLSGISGSIDELTENIRQLDEMKKDAEAGKLTPEVISRINDTLIRLSRCITNAFYTNAEKYDQDSYGRTILSKPLPLLYPVIELSRLDKSELRYKLIYTWMLRNRNRVSDAIDTANDYVKMLLVLR